VPNPKRVSQADPFVVEVRDTAYLFFEQVQPGTPGRIAVAELDGATLRGITTCLARDHHLSYPFVFEDGGSMFLMPESLATKSVELYRASHFPREWVHERTLLANVLAVDPTLVQHEGRWWLFVGTSATGASPSEELSIFHSRSLHGEWTPHPENPVVADVRWARPAGRVFRVGDSLVRPAQNGSGGYGRSIALRRIVTLTTEHYMEEAIGELTADWLRGAHATHTFGRGRNVEVTDGQRWVVRLPWHR
jgi:hypothetical protein